MKENEISEYVLLESRIAEISRQLNELAESASNLLFSNLDYESKRSKLVASKRSKRAILNAAKITYSLRRSRSNLFKDDSLFGEPAWDILLDLFIADLKGVSLSISDACIGSASAQTTALRWIGVLQESEIVARSRDPRDARRAHLSLTDKGFNLMQTYFEHALDLIEK